MGIEEKINADVKASMLAKNAKRLEAVRAIKSVILLLKTSPEGLTEDSATKAIQKEYKKRKETYEIYVQQNRPDLADDELSQALVMEEYLPKALSEEELKTIIKNAITEIGATSSADMGKVMGAANKTIAGRADGKLVSQLVKTMLG
ncbi:MAG: GatB/YqeY domain-containing protein [Burkholderiales bacterium]|nr:GatB/YqeY domain-containing protein [Bacteroidia bacterium]